MDSAFVQGSSEIIYQLQDQFEDMFGYTAARSKKFKQHACEFKNEAECEEEIEDEGLDFEKVEEEYFESEE